MDVQSHFNASDTDRKSWSRQRKNALSGEFAVPELIQFFSLSEEEGKILQHNIQQVNIRLTPYVIQLIQEVGDALKKQLLPIYHKIDALPPSLWDDSFRDEEFISHAQNKYADSRVLVRIAHLCDSFCQFCFQAERTLNPESPGHGGEAELDQVTKYISTHPTISEIILSGGDPMTLGNRTLKKYLQKIRSISRAANDPLLIRINTRNLTFNPYRFDEEFAKLCHEYGVNSLGIHATHPGELVEVVKEKIALLRRASPYTALFLNTPLLAGVNDTVETMKELLVKARTFGIEPRYVYHTMPETPNGTLFHVPIVQAIEFMKSFSMNIASTIRPRFVIVPEEGKFEPSLYGIPNYEIIDNGTGITYKNRKGEEMIYRDPL